MLINVHDGFLKMVNTLAQRAKVEQDPSNNLWALVIDGETVSWYISKDRAYDFGVTLYELGFFGE